MIIRMEETLDEGASTGAVHCI